MTTLLLAGVAVGALAFGQFILHFWLGAAFAHESTTVLHLLMLGVFANSLAQVPFWQIQAASRPDLPAKIHLIELPCYLLTFWVLTKNYGINGAGIAWMLRTTIDAAVMYWFSARLLAEVRPFVRQLLWLTISVCPLFLISVLIKNGIAATVFAAVVCIVFLPVVWFWFLTEQERALVRNPVRFLIHRQQVPLAEMRNS